MPLTNYKNISTNAIRLFMFFAIIHLLKGTLENWLNTLLAVPFLSKVATGLLNDILVIVLSVIIFRYLFLQGYRFVLIHLSGLSGLFYFDNRFTNDWLYIHFSYGHIAYLDCLFLAVFLPGLLVFFRSRKSIEIIPNSIQQGFHEDNPITTSDLDSFKRGSFATKLAETLAATKNKKSFAIGILGSYGSGKTSFLKLIVLALQKLPVPPVIIDFNPWTSESAANIQKDFFDILAERLMSLDPKLPSVIYNYSRRISRTDKSLQNWVNKFNLIRKFRSSQKDQSDYERLNKLLENCNQKIVICIDDVDRLYPPEIIEVLRLVRNTANFANICYLVAYDKAYINEALTTINTKPQNEFLDKIFQLEVPLPKPDEHELRDLLNSMLKSILTSEHATVFENEVIAKEFTLPLESSYKQIIRNARDVVRYVNSFIISYQLIGQEVDFKCLFLLELLKFRFPLIYDLIYEKRHQFLNRLSISSVHKEFYTIVTVEDPLLPELIRYLRDIHPGYYNNDDLRLVKIIFEKLFPGGAYRMPESHKQGISNPLLFELYFRSRLSVYDISESSFSTALKSQQSQLFYAYIDECISKDIYKPLESRLLQERKFINRRHFQMVLGGIFRLGTKYVQEFGFQSFNYEAVVSLLIDNEKDLLKSIYRKEREGFFNDVNFHFENALPDYIFQSELIYHIKKRTGAFVIDREILTQHQINYFSKYTDSLGFDKNSMWLLWGIREYFETRVDDDSIKFKTDFRIEKAVIPVLKRLLVAKDQTTFIIGTIEFDFYSKDVARIYSYLLDLFETPAALRQIVDDSEFIRDDVKTEYLKFFDECSKNDFKQMIRFDFETSLSTGYKTQVYPPEE